MCSHLPLIFSVNVKDRQDKLPTVYWLCTTTELSKFLTSCLTAVKTHVIRYWEKVNERSDKNFFWSIKISSEVVNIRKLRRFRATSLSTYDFSTLFTTLPHYLIKEKLKDLIEWSFQREGSLYLACNETNAFFTSEHQTRYKLWSSFDRVKVTKL